MLRGAVGGEGDSAGSAPRVELRRLGDRPPSDFSASFFGAEGTAGRRPKRRADRPGPGTFFPTSFFTRDAHRRSAVKFLIRFWVIHG